MRIRNLAQLYERIQESPIQHLGERSPRTLNAYEQGYDAGLYFHGCEELIDDVVERLHAEVGKRVVFTAEHAGRLNARAPLSPRSYALLNSADEVEALSVYFDLWFAVREQLATATSSDGGEGEYHTWARIDENALSLIDHLQRIRKRPGMWFGSAHVSNLWAFVSGFTWAERDIGTSSFGVAKFRAFQEWVDQRYPFGAGGTWARTFRFLGVSNPALEDRAFWEHFDMFLAGSRPTDPDPTMEAMLEAIVAMKEPED